MDSAIWMHCPGNVNPADIPSRGLNIIDHDMRQKWLFGPDFLMENQNSWPKTILNEKTPSNSTVEVGKSCLLVSHIEMNGVHKIIDIKRYSAFIKFM